MHIDQYITFCYMLILDINIIQKLIIMLKLYQGNRKNKKSLKLII